MQLPEWLIAFLPQWEQAAGCVLAGTAIAMAWAAHRREALGRRPKRMAIAWFMMIVTFVIALVVAWADSRDLARSLARALVIGGASPLIWEVALALAWRFAPWLAVRFGEDRRKYRRALFEDTGDLDRRELERWRAEQRARNGAERD